jgi:hypothetical protein
MIENHAGQVTSFIFWRRLRSTVKPSISKSSLTNWWQEYLFSFRYVLSTSLFLPHAALVGEGFPLIWYAHGWEFPGE